MGDIVGDLFKDAAGSSHNTLIIMISLVSSLIAMLVFRYNLLTLLGW